MKQSILFLAIAVVATIIWGAMFSIGISNPQTLLAFSPFMMVSGWAAGICFVVGIVLFIIGK